MKKRRFFIYPLLFLLISQVTWAQQRQINGVIKNEQGEPIPNATIKQEGANNSTLAAEDGGFGMTVFGNNVILEVSSVNYITKKVTVGAATSVNIFLQQNQQADMDEVVVTALGIKREKRSLGYSTQEVSGADLSISKQTNVVNALRGKVAGVQINSGGGAPGQGSRIIIRGLKSLDPGKDQQPLFIIDGIIMDNSTNTADDAGSLRGMSNRAADINPDDIETINILRGGAATALYGQAGSAGVVVITTKSAKTGKMKISFNNTYGIDEVNKFPEVQTKFTQGNNSIYSVTEFFPAWGPTIEEAKAIDPTHPDKLFNQFSRAYQTGSQFRSSLNMSGGTENALVSSSFSYFKQKGVIPFSDFKSINARLSAQIKISDKLKFTPSIIYTNSGGYRVNADRFNEGLVYWSPRWDVKDYLKPDGTMNTYPALANNPIYVNYSNRFKDNVNRIIGNTALTYSPFSWLDFNYRLGIDYYSDFRKHAAPGPLGIPDEVQPEDNGLGFVNEYRISNRLINSIAILTFKKDWTEKFNTTLRIGNDIRDKKYTRLTSTGEELDIPTLLSINNAKVIKSDSWEENYRIYSVFGDFTTSWDNFLFLNLTGRNDWTSTLPYPNNKFFYPSASISYVFTEHLKNKSWLTYGKLRASIAGVGKDTDPYETNTYYIPTPLSTTGQVLWSRGATLGNQDLLPERTSTLELGTELKFLKNRIGLDFTWYKLNSRDLIIPVSLSPTTGYTAFTTNAGEIENKGIEFVLTGSPVQTNNFNWDITINYAANKNKVVKINEGLDEIIVGDQFGYSGATATLKYRRGQPVGGIYGSSNLRYYGTIPDDKITLYDLPLVIANSGTNSGFPVRDGTQRLLGNSQPKWMGGINNTITYKTITLSMLWETQQGLDRYNQLGNFIAAFGEAKFTENRRDTKVFDGVTADGAPNTQLVWLGQAVGPDGRNYTAGYYRNVYRTITENFVEDASWIRLRTLSLSYMLPQKLFKGNFIQNASITATGNNLLLFTNYSGYDPESSSSAASSNADGFNGFSYPALRTFMLGINLNF